jgi:hypothetical protein
METRIRLRLGDLEVECTSDDVFVATRLPDLVSDLLRRLRDQQPVPTPHPSEFPSPLPRTVSIAGTVIDYFSGNPVTAARVSATGLTPDLSGTSDAAGRYAFSGQTAGAECFLSVTDVESFVETATGPFKVAAAPLTLTAFAATATDLNRQYAIVGRSPSSGLGVVIVHLLDAAGRPLEMVTASDVALAADNGPLVGAGPFFFGPAGDIEPQLTVSRAFNGTARAAFLDVPAGSCTLQVTASNGGLAFQRATMRLLASAGAVIAEATLGSS